MQSLSFSPDSSWLITACTLGVLKLFSTAELIDTCTSSNQDIAELVSIDDAHDMGVVCCDFSTFQEVTCTQTLQTCYFEQVEKMRHDVLHARTITQLLSQVTSRIPSFINWSRAATITT